MMLHRIAQHFYKILGVIAILIGLGVLLYGATYSKPLGELNKISGILSSYELGEGLVSLTVAENEYIYRKNDGNYQRLIDYLAAEAASNTAVTIFARRVSEGEEVKYEIESLKTPDFTIRGLFEEDDDSFKAFIRSIYYLGLAIIAIGIIGFIFGDRLAKLDKELDD
jgi:hypothetical protein